MFGEEIEVATQTRAKIEQLEVAMFESITAGEDFGKDGDTNSQQTCMLSAVAYGTAALAMRAKMTAGELK